MASPAAHLGRIGSAQATRRGLSRFSRRGLSRFSRSENGTVPLCNPRITPYDVVRVVLGLILLTAAALKGHQLATEPGAETSLLTSRWFLIGVVQFELFFGLWLLAGVLPKVSWPVATACFGCFAAVSLGKGLAGEVSCGCFGKVAVDPWHVLGLDLAAVTALLCFRPQRGPLALASRSGSVRLRVAAMIVLWLAGGGTIAWGAVRLDKALANGQGVIRRGGLVILEPERWVGSEFPLLGHTDLGGRLAEGDWAVMLYHRECDACKEAILRCEAASPGGNTARLALLEVPPCAGVPGELKSFLAGREYLCGCLEGSVEWFVATPVVITLRKGVVVGVVGPGDLLGKRKRTSDVRG